MLEPECRRYIVEHTHSSGATTQQFSRTCTGLVRMGHLIAPAHSKSSRSPTASLLCSRVMHNRCGTQGGCVGVSHPFARIVVHERALRLPTAQGVLRHLGRAAQRLLEITLIAAERPSVDLLTRTLRTSSPHRPWYVAPCSTSAS